MAYCDIKSLALIILLYPALVHSENLTFFTEKATTVAGWLVRATAHQPLMSATPRAKRQDLAVIKNSKNDNLKEGELGFSSMKAVASAEVRDAYAEFDLGVDKPKELNVLRLQYTKDLGVRSDFSISYMNVPDISIQGQGAHFYYNFLKLGNFYTTTRSQYSWVKKIDFFKSQSFAQELTQSWNTPLVDLYLGTKYYYARTHFFATTVGGPVPTIKHYTPVNELEYFIGFSKGISKKLRFDGQIKQAKEERSFIGKITFDFSPFTQKNGEWRLPTVN